MKIEDLRLWRFLAACLAVAIGVGAAGLGALPAGAAPLGSISGQVVDSGGNPIPNVCVAATGATSTSTSTDSSGLYSLVGLESGDYDVLYRDCTGTSTYVDQWYQGRLDQSSADPVTVVDPADTALPDVTMATGVAVEGTVTDSGGNPVGNVNVNVNPIGSGSSVWAQTAPDGTYRTGALPTGSYRVQFTPTDPQYATEWWNDETSWSTADTLSIDTVNGPTHSGVDAQLAAAATVEGTVTDTGGSPLAGVCVEPAVPNSSGNWDWLDVTVQTQVDGTYSVGGLPAADVRMYFSDCSGGPYLSQWYSGQAQFEGSTPLVLAGGELRTGVDAQLGTGTAVSGTVTDGSGNPIQGVNINIDPVDAGSSAGAQTGPSGQYTTDALPPGDYTVRFQSTPTFAGEYWDDELARADADVLTITGSEGPVRGNVDAVLAVGATVSGRVTDADDGQPVANLCVYALVTSSDGFDGVAYAVTAVDGTYTMTGVPPATVNVVFHDCNTVGPYVQAWWDGATGPGTATPIALAAGELRPGVDAQLVRAGAITGRVTDGGGNPIEGICAQASTPTFVGNLATTDSNGDYAILLSQAGDYKVQFVDCSGSGTFAGQWWNAQPSAATAQAVSVASGEVVTGIDATLAPGATGTISGRVVNAGGTPMTSACVLAYLPYEFVLFAPIQPDGTYTIPDVPSGTYALAFLGCGSGEPEPTVDDPDLAGVAYSARWWDGVPLSFDESDDGGPDPVAQGANLVTVAPGASLVGYDGCFGCDVITITSITPGPNSLTVAFTTPFADSGGASGAGGAGAGLSAAAAVSSSGVSVDGGVPISYIVTCSSPSGGVTRSASGPGSPITVSSLTAGASYICQVAAASGGTIFATSAASDVLEAGVTASGGAGPSGTGSGADPSGTRGATGSLPRTGAASGPLLRAGFVLFLIGCALALPTRRRPEGGIARG